MKLNLTKLRKNVPTGPFGIFPLMIDEYVQLLNIVVATVRRNEQEKKIAAFPVADEGLPGYIELREKNLELSNAVRKLLEDVEIGDG